MSARNQVRRFGNLRILSASLAVAAILTAATPSQPARAAAITVYKSPWCGCCEQWIGHMRTQGHAVTSRNMEDLDAIKKMSGVPEALQSCHTALVAGYVLEGHVPAADLARLLAERPEARGLAVPGMPGGAPGMESAAAEPYDVMLFQADGGTRVFSRH
jgi:hypothetical protein